MSRPLVVLMGLKHSGKSSISHHLSRELGLPAIDLDDLIATLALKQYPDLPKLDSAATVRQLYRSQGKAVFQALELAAVQELVASVAGDADQSPARLILALGGGSMENHPAMQVLQACSWIVFLDSDCDLLFSRISKTGLPAFLDPADPQGSFRKLFEVRRELALGLANLVVPLGIMNLQQASAAVLKSLKEQHYVS